MKHVTLWFLSVFAFAGVPMAAEVKMLGPEIQQALSDSVYVGAEAAQDIEQIFQSNGLTLYKAAGNQSQGSWKVEGNRYCSLWPPSDYWSCYDVVVNDRVVTFIASNGTRYPMRRKSP